MSLVNSTPLAFDQVGWGQLLRACVLVWLAPAVLAAALLLLQLVAGTRDMGGGWSVIWAYTILLLSSPLLSWLILVLAVPFVQVLMNRGWFGWIPALVAGMAAGALVGFALRNDLPITLGAAMMLGLRWYLGRRFPAAFVGAL